MKGVIVVKINGDFESKQSIKDKIAKIDAIIDSLMTTAMTSVTSGNIAEYQIDTGQTTNRVRYTDINQITTTITNYEKIRQMYVNKLVGRKHILVDGSNFRIR
jgi:spore coat protein CotF